MDVVDGLAHSSREHCDEQLPVALHAHETTACSNAVAPAGWPVLQHWTHARCVDSRAHDSSPVGAAPSPLDAPPSPALLQTGRLLSQLLVSVLPEHWKVAVCRQSR
jgi:hypothetical protein